MTIRHHFTTLIALFFIFSVPSFAVPISDISTQKVQGYRSSPPYGWNYAYNVEFSNLQINVHLPIMLIGDTPSASLKATWENGIESMWSRKFDIIDTQGSYQYHYHVNFDVQFCDYSNYQSAYHWVNVITGTGHGDMLHWYTDSGYWGDSYHAAFAAHEVGHMFSLYDEYAGGAVDPVNTIIDYKSIMGSLMYGAKERHYDPFLDWLDSQSQSSGHQLSIGAYDPFWTIPEPATILLLALGGIFLRRKQS